MRTEIYEHFHPDERDYVDRASEWISHAGAYHEQKLTDFWIRGNSTYWRHLLRRKTRSRLG